MHSVLVVANQTAESEELLAKLRERAEQGRCAFTILIPATPHGISWAANMNAGKGREEAAAHRDALVARLRAAGIEVMGAIVGDSDPLAAITDTCSVGDYDELIISTLPRHVSRWLHLDLPRKAAHATGLPITSVEASRSKASA